MVSATLELLALPFVVEPDEIADRRRGLDVKSDRCVLDRLVAEAEEGEEQIELGPGEGSIHFLQKVYRKPRQPLATRLRAAIEALPFEAPKLSAVATTTMNGADFATMLERAIERSGRAREVKQIEPLAIEAKPAPGAIKRRAIP